MLLVSAKETNCDAKHSPSGEFAWKKNVKKIPNLLPPNGDQMSHQCVFVGGGVQFFSWTSGLIISGPYPKLDFLMQKFFFGIISNLKLSTLALREPYLVAYI